MNKEIIDKFNKHIPIQLDDSDDDEELRRVLEMSLLEAGRGPGNSSQTEDEDEDLQRAVELSLLSEPLKKFTTKVEEGHKVVDDIDNKEGLKKENINEVEKCDIDDSLIVLTKYIPVNAIEISDDEFDSLCSDTSFRSLKDRLDHPVISTDSILIESDSSPILGEMNIKNTMKITNSVTVVQANVENLKSFVNIKVPGLDVATGSTSSKSRVLSSRFDSVDEDLKSCDGSKEVPAASMPGQPAQSSLSTKEVNRRMRNVFTTGLAIHFSGEEMEACKALSTTLFPHQRVALAWMFRHENKETDGMRGGILADDMGLGKTLTVISLIMTNHWDGMPLSKPELGFTRPPLSLGQRGGKSKKENAGGAFRPMISPASLGVGSKIAVGCTKKTNIGGLFDKFNESSDSDSGKEKGKFEFSKQKNMKSRKGVKQLIDDSDSDSDEGGEASEDEFDKMYPRDKTFKPSSIDLFKKEEKSLDTIISVDYHNMSEEDFMLSMIPTALDGVCKTEFNSKINLDGFVDGSSSDEDGKPATFKVSKRDFLDFDSEEDVCSTSTSSYKQEKKRKLGENGKLKQQPTKKLKQNQAASPKDESDISLPDLSPGASTPNTNKLPRKLGEGIIKEIEDPVKMNAETGLKLIIPPKNPAVRAGRRRATLLVCPTSLISHWVEQLEMHLDKSVNIKVKIHHGAGKALTGANLECHDLVITTYGTLAAEWGMQVSPLTKAKWLRVVLDEGHNIKNHNSKSAKGCLGLDTTRKWIVSGTPIQNNLMELWSLVNWLGFGLYAGTNQMKVFKQQIEGPCKKGLPQGFERLQVLMDTICLRRTKTDRKPDGSPLVPLPNKKIITRVVELSEEERLCYAIYHKRAQEIVGRYHKKGQLLRNYAHVFALMTKLRQLCCHREMIKEVDWVEALRDKEELASQLEGYLDKDDVTTNVNVQNHDGADSGLEEDLERRLVGQLRELIKSGVSDDCSVCLDDLKTPVITPCAHVFCRTCIERVLETIKPPNCPLCRSKIDNKKQLLEAGHDDEGEEQTNPVTNMEDIDVNVSSSKVNAVLKEMLRIQRDCPDDKIIVVSQFTSLLSILQPLVKQNNFSMVRLDGTMSHYDRSEVVTVFQSITKNSPKVLLLSLKAGGVGLNLTAANHLMLLDPAWNPASEWQCFDRTHRLGQKKDVTIYKYITNDSIEEKMLEIQAKKEDLISGAFNMPAEDRRMQRVDDIRNIFGI